MVKFQPNLFQRLSLLLIGVLPLVAARNATAEPVILPLYKRLVELAPDLSAHVAELATTALRCARDSSTEIRSNRFAIIDYSLPSTDKRFWLFDLQQHRLLLADLVAHGKNSGENRAESFSNRPGSLQSSLGLFQIGSSYIGAHGNSLRLIGLEPGVNDLASERQIVIHGADYVSDSFIQLHHRLGRSFGCPALAPKSAAKVIEYFEESPGLLFSYYPDKEWLNKSSFLNDCVSN